MTRILIVEDEAGLRQGLEINLRHENYETVTYTLTAMGSATEVAITESNVATPEQRATSEKMWGGALSELKKVAEQ